MKGQKVITQQVEGGQWQARYEGGFPNDFQTGATEQEAKDALLKHSLQTSVSKTGEVRTGEVRTESTLSQSVEAKTDRIIIKKLPHPTEINGKLMTHAAYRESAPEVQSYGMDEQSARVQFLTDRKSDEQGKKKK